MFALRAANRPFILEKEHAVNVRSLKSLAVAATLAALGTATLTAAAADWSDTSVSYLYGNRFRESYIPFNRNLSEPDISKNIINFTHVDGYKYGGNLISIDLLKSDHNDPASGGSTEGAHDVYAVFRTDLSFSKISGTKLDMGFIRDFALTAGFDYSNKDTDFAARTWRPKIGPKVEFNVPGFWNVAVVWQHETNHCGTCDPAFGQKVDVNFGNYWGVETAWGIGIGDTGLSWKGVLTYYGKKGDNGDGSPTAPETFLRTSLMYDVGALMGKKGTVFAGLGWEFWNNQFGNKTTFPGYPFGGAGQSIPGTRTSTPLLIAEWHM